MPSRRYQTYFFVTALLASIIMTLVIFRSYLVPLAIGAVIAVVARPFYRAVVRFIRSPSASAFLVITVVTTIVVLPTVFFFAALSVEVGQLFGNISGALGLQDITGWLGRYLPPSFQAQIPMIIEQFVGFIQIILTRISGGIVVFFSNAVGFTLGFLVILVAAYYLLKDGDKLRDELMKLSPLNDEHDRTVLARLTESIRAVVGGLLVIALVKGITSGFALWAFGVPAPFFWGTLAGLSFFLPLVGSGIILLPAALYLLAVGHLGAAIGLALVSVTIIGLIDNLLQPKLVESRTKIHPLLILLSIVGGLEFYGFFGFILGPLTLTVALALLDIYENYFRSRLLSSPDEKETD